MEVKVITKSADETQNIGKFIAQYLKRGMVFALNGDLGAGKTTFTQGVAKGLGIENHVSSPTFNILKCYFEGRLPLYHIDAYRLEQGTNKDIGLEEVIDGDGVCLVEWSMFIKEMLQNACEININKLSENEREFIFIAKTNDYKELFDELKKVSL